MKKTISIVTLMIVISVTTFAQDDAEGCKDSPMFNRLPNYYITQCSKNYDEVNFPMSDEKEETKEGTKTVISYDFNEETGADGPSFFQIVKNYENAVIKIGGKKVYYLAENFATLYAKAGGKDVWIKLNYSGDSNYDLTILEIESMKQEISANEMLEALNKSGFIALYINFETGKSDIKPESQTAVDQIAEMLQSDPSLKVSIEGHTDDVGVPATNQTLSENRAKAVMNYLIAKGIDKTRLTSKGWGQTKPIADNRTEEGKAKNRRVEIVKF